ncbi:GatB/YqeY domain-containing protein [Clostridium botulinum]|uniref:tRNA modifying protein n=4 Tax=Clostridium botulinum TaxID=1491 RepID=A5I633_CLOBH|nr:GatB/YqeY domain-containing protein [Clostridium botulinum]EKN42843.1 GatB/Yqey domain-containing protein [Clostridium botulinum CFSAN001627]EPS48506.1 GatB/Yqey domain-containing protein [Clostridium botulinum CFSAN002367]KRU25211.1 subunit B of aspartyl/glutamyl-tRNA amidotransferase [Clostridium sporogenes]ABS34081.1 GatB/Yqey domain protein [Clostridium botulinum A str. ATCC 19397]ABS38651.1 GatB/Yqey domain protein [Clostridium botulinum A str. Hall]
MSLKETLQDHWKQALKAKEKEKASTISMVKAAILLAEKNSGKTLEDSEIIDILSKEIKQRKEALEDFKKGNRQDLVDATNFEIEVLLKYLPQQLTEEEITEIIEKAVNETGANSMKHMKNVMSIVIPKTKGRADGKLVSEKVKNILSK